MFSSTQIRETKSCLLIKYWNCDYFLRYLVIGWWGVETPAPAIATLCLSARYFTQLACVCECNEKVTVGLSATVMAYCYEYKIMNTAVSDVFACPGKCNTKTMHYSEVHGN